MRIAIFGTRGIPARYGGFETFAEELAPRLVRRGHAVTVFGRAGVIDPALHLTQRDGVTLVVLPAPRSKHFETVVHTLRCALWSRREPFDVALVCNGANFLSLVLLTRLGTRTALLVDGIESARRKWGWLGRVVHRLGERLGPRLADVVVADCEVIADHYRRRGAPALATIAYGAEPPRCRTTGALERLGVRSRGYVLYVSRLEPENNADLVVRAFRQSTLDYDLVVVGDAPYATAYKTEVRRLAAGDPRIHFAGFVFGEGYDELRAHAACWVQATEVGGTHPALLEAMAASLPVIAQDIPEHREVLGDAGWYFGLHAADELTARLGEVLAPGAGAAAERERRGLAASARVRERYDWEKVADAYDLLARRLVDAA